MTAPRRFGCSKVSRREVNYLDLINDIRNIGDELKMRRVFLEIVRPVLVRLEPEDEAVCHSILPRAITQATTPKPTSQWRTAILGEDDILLTCRPSGLFSRPPPSTLTYSCLVVGWIHSDPSPIMRSHAWGRHPSVSIWRIQDCPWIRRHKLTALTSSCGTRHLKVNMTMWKMAIVIIFA